MPRRKRALPETDEEEEDRRAAHRALMARVRARQATDRQRFARAATPGRNRAADRALL